MDAKRDAPPIDDVMPASGPVDGSSGSDTAPEPMMDDLSPATQDGKDADPVEASVISAALAPIEAEADDTRDTAPFAHDAQAEDVDDGVLPEAHDAGSADGDGPQSAPESTGAAGTAESDLEQLPGAGDGLVWILQRQGIESLADLAEADADRLTADLGVIGQLLDVKSWIAYARSATDRDPD